MHIYIYTYMYTFVQTSELEWRETPHDIKLAVGRRPAGRCLAGEGGSASEDSWHSDKVIH